MNRVHLLGVCAAFMTAVPAQAAPAVARSPTVAKNAQCLVLYLAAASDGKDQKIQQAAIAGSWYFLGQLDVGAPGAALVELLRDASTTLQGNPRAKEIGGACDAELAKRGRELMDAGQQLEGETAQSSSSS
jgi:hypothetical protein